MTVEIGDPIPNLGIQIQNAQGVNEDAGAVTLTILAPDQSVISPVISHTVGTGFYSASHTVDQAGQYRVTWTATGVNAGVFVDVVTVESPEFGIVSVQAVKDALRIRRSDTDDDIAAAILTASDICEGTEGTNKTWRRTVVTDEVHSGGPSFQLNRSPILEVTSLSSGGTVLDLADYDVDLESGRIFGVDGGTRRGQVRVSYVAGVAGPIPAGVREGCIEFVRHLMASRRGGSGIPRQDEPDFSQGPGYLIPNRVVVAWRGASGVGL